MKKFLAGAAVLALLMGAPQVSAADDFNVNFHAQKKIEVTTPKKLKPVDPIKTQRPGSSTPDTQRPAKPPMG